MSDQQTWIRPVAVGTVGQIRAQAELHLDLDETGRALVHEAVLGQLLLDAGSKRTA
ncbi:hypothetical protein GON03_19140 [Nocardioides sp. MAH-18]|uniref:Uncharacterized protein n=1 Tax=Nocardioides agri TaxID=2682843 RepID=A0A6L6XWZ8_9ACTN|nr:MULTISPECIES: hypothetical protein [unclassified Nocardioides]MBA2952133.1 hypothetical protein [Nocardioides sp. CGMCC 1.13656]MVQ51302.1 hypothetical protein [Nocardioides sp. MAH-18]